MKMYPKFPKSLLAPRMASSTAFTT